LRKTFFSERNHDRRRRDRLKRQETRVDDRASRKARRISRANDLIKRIG